MDADKRFLVFTFDNQYPNGGMSDISGSFDTLQEALDHLGDCESDNAEIYDRVEGREIDIESKPAIFSLGSRLKKQQEPDMTDLLRLQGKSILFHGKEESKSNYGQTKSKTNFRNIS